MECDPQLHCWRLLKWVEWWVKRRINFRRQTKLLYVIERVPALPEGLGRKDVEEETSIIGIADAHFWERDWWQGELCCDFFSHGGLDVAVHRVYFLNALILYGLFSKFIVFHQTLCIQCSHYIVTIRISPKRWHCVNLDEELTETKQYG